MSAQETEAELEARLAAERLGVPFLVYRDDEERQLIVDLSLPWDPEVSRLHAELAFRGGEWTICDDGWSQNGTWVNELRLTGRRRLSDGDLIRVGRTTLAFCRPGMIAIGPTLVPGELSATPRFSEQQQRILRALCRPLFGDAEQLSPAGDEEIAAETGISTEFVRIELDHLGRALGLEDLPEPERRLEVALLAMRSGLVDAAEGG